MSNSKNILSLISKRLPFVGQAPPLVSVIELNGTIGAAGLGGRGLSLSKLESIIDAAFKPSKLAAVALAINSPGGSPVQSNLIHGAIRAAAEKKKVPVIAFIEDVGASGGYILALAGDEIYADASSIVGSIGVISAGFGLENAIEKLGVTRRVYAAGDAKSQLDPFQQENSEDVARLNAILDDLHQQFIELVKDRRGRALNAEMYDTFSGAFWTAAKAQERGLIDGIGRLGDFLRARFGDDVIIKRVAKRGSPLKRILGADEAVNSKNVSLVRPEEIVSLVQERALWARFGL